MPSTGHGLIVRVVVAPVQAAAGDRVVLEAQAHERGYRLSFRSMIARALFSWSVTHAVFESCETAMYSGSRSCATVAPGPKIRIDGVQRRPLNAVNPAVVTSAWSARLRRREGR